MYVPDNADTEKFMQLDKEFLKKYYTEPETEFAVYRLKGQKE